MEHSARSCSTWQAEMLSEQRRKAAQAALQGGVAAWRPSAAAAASPAPVHRRSTSVLSRAQTRRVAFTHAVPDGHGRGR